ncbi:Octanoyltransferase [Trichinella spiralis]|uniref:Octanoyltransferase n=1 Tax=Trichinella spiralis TaxID=6334 RepID=A0ABR3KL93_TRISP
MTIEEFDIKNHSKRCDAMEMMSRKNVIRYFNRASYSVGAVAPISCLVGEAAKPSPPEAAAEHAFSFSGRTSDTSPVEYIVLAGIGFFVVNIRKSTAAAFWLSFQLFKSNLRLVTPRRNLNEFIIFVVDRVILAGFHFELLKG